MCIWSLLVKCYIIRYLSVGFIQRNGWELYVGNITGLDKVRPLRSLKVDRRPTTATVDSVDNLQRAFRSYITSRPTRPALMAQSGQDENLSITSIKYRYLLRSCTGSTRLCDLLTIIRSVCRLISYWIYTVSLLSLFLIATYSKKDPLSWHEGRFQFLPRTVRVVTPK